MKPWWWLLCSVLLATRVAAQDGTAFTYQGRLEDGAVPANGNYEFEFRLFNVPGGGAPLALSSPPAPVAVSDGTFTTTVDFGALFTGADLYLELAVRVAGNPGFTTLAPRQRITPAPGAQFAQLAAVAGANSVDAASVVDGTLSAADAITSGPNGLQRRIGGACAAAGESIKQINADGSVACEPDDVGSFDGWSLTGNAGTDPASNFIGTTDAQPLVLRTGGVRAQRLGVVDGVLNVTTGGEGSQILDGAKGGVIAGGDGRLINPMRVHDDFGTIGGGQLNQIGNADGNPSNAALATIAGGASNFVGGFGGAVGGGQINAVSGAWAAVPGGFGNRAGGDFSLAAGTNAEVRNATQAGEPGCGLGTCGDEGTFVWSDTGLGPFTSTGPNQFLVRAAGGVAINTNAPRAMLTLRGPDDFTAGPIVQLFGNAADQVESGRIRFVEGTAANNARGAYLRYDGAGNALHLGVHPTADVDPLNDVDQLTILRSATPRVGVGTTSPQRALDVTGTVRASEGFEFATGGVQAAAADPPDEVYARSGLSGTFFIGCSGLTTTGARLAQPFTVVKPPAQPHQVSDLVLEREVSSNTAWRAAFENGTAIASCSLFLSTTTGSATFTFPSLSPRTWGLFTADDGRPVERLGLAVTLAGITRTVDSLTPTGTPTLASFRGFRSQQPPGAAYTVSYAGAALTGARVYGDFRREDPGAAANVTVEALRVRINPSHQPGAVTFLGDVRSGQVRSLQIVLAGTSSGDVTLVDTANATCSAYTLRLGEDGLPIEEASFRF